MVVFEDVDITVVVEAERRGDLVPRPFVLRKAESKSVQEINEALERQKKKAAPGKLVLGDKKSARIARLGLAMPAFIRRRAMRLLARRPLLVKANMGTVLVTSLGMFGSFTGYALPISMDPLTFAIGSVSKKPGVVDDRVEVREFLHLTTLFDHDVVDGGPAARFTARLAELLESSHGLTAG